jgi:hypothetical protein
MAEWRKAKQSLAHVDIDGRPACRSNGKGRGFSIADAPLLPEDWDPSQGMRKRADGSLFFPAKAEACMRCVDWLKRQGRWPFDDD